MNDTGWVEMRTIMDSSAATSAALQVFVDTCQCRNPWGSNRGQALAHSQWRPKSRARDAMHRCREREIGGPDNVRAHESDQACELRFQDLQPRQYYRFPQGRCVKREHFIWSGMVTLFLTRKRCPRASHVRSVCRSRTELGGCWLGRTRWDAADWTWRCGTSEGNCRWDGRRKGYD